MPSVSDVINSQTERVVKTYSYEGVTKNGLLITGYVFAVNSFTALNEATKRHNVNKEGWRALHLWARTEDTRDKPTLKWGDLDKSIAELENPPIPLPMLPSPSANLTIVPAKPHIVVKNEVPAAKPDTQPKRAVSISVDSLFKIRSG